MKKDIACPRCGGGIEVFTGSGKTNCLNSRCKAYWNSFTAYEREVTARSLADTVADPVSEEYLTEEGKGTLAWELQELQSLASYLALDKVRTNLLAAIESRKGQVAAGTLERLVGSWQVDTLVGMLVWVEDTMKEYDTNGE